MVRGFEGGGVLLGTCSLINHACHSANAKWSFHRQGHARTAIAVAERRIAAGEEILWDYGEQYWCGERKGRVPEGADCACWD